LPTKCAGTGKWQGVEARGLRLKAGKGGATVKVMFLFYPYNRERGGSEIREEKTIQILTIYATILGGR